MVCPLSGKKQNCEELQLVVALGGRPSRRLTASAPDRSLGERFPLARFPLLESGHTPSGLLSRLFVCPSERFASPCFLGIQSAVAPGRFLYPDRGDIRRAGRSARKCFTAFGCVDVRLGRGRFGEPLLGSASLHLDPDALSLRSLTPRLLIGDSQCVRRGAGLCGGLLCGGSRPHFRLLGVDHVAVYECEATLRKADFLLRV
jgi:hypothetical protein